MAANICIFLSAYVTLQSDHEIFALYRDFALIPVRVSDGADYYTLISSMFLHGGFMHLAGNMLFLWIFGDNMEDEMGHIPFLIFYLLAGIGAGVLHVFASPVSVVPTIGASGAIAGVMGGYLLLFPKARVDILLIIVVFFKIFPVPAWVMLGVWLAMQFVGGVGSDPDQGGVAYWAHTGGFFVGLILTIPLWLRRGGTAFWTRTHGQPPHPEHEYKYSNSRIPRIPRRGRESGNPWGR
jgi:membrane associated rhomboid family serine protease